MEADLRRLVETVRNPPLRLLLDALYGERSEVWQRFRRAPAAKFYHQAYCHGLLEHTLSVGQAVSAISACFPGIDRDLAVTGALIHDIGKIEAYAQDPTAIDLTDDGKLHGEIPLGYYLVRSTIERIDGFPEGLARALLHILLSHHGTYENGSPVTPAHPRGHDRARDRQPRREARQLRPPREGPPGRRDVDSVRPRDRGLRVVPGGERRRHGAARAGRRAAHGRLRRVAARLIRLPGPYPAPARTGRMS